MTSTLRHVSEALPPKRQWTILNNHRVIYIVTNTSMVLSCALVAYSMMIAGVGLSDAINVIRMTLNCISYVNQYVTSAASLKIENLLQNY